ncbi:MAG: NAD(+) diphosphatase [Chitinivibrionales bacterium]|nr:NAD(+) diphosphatase [Chitinivibrionales bacterium]
MKFKPSVVGHQNSVDLFSYFFCIQQDMVVLTGESAIPSGTMCRDAGLIQGRDAIFLGMADERACFAVELPKEIVLPPTLIFCSMRQTFRVVGQELFRIIGFARSIIDWNRNFKFCGACGRPTENLTGERAKICPTCGLTSYPRISPAIIVSVTDGPKILLARSQKFQIATMYSVLAGFVEPSESLEECVSREVMEEVSLQIRDIRYFGSQSWPFPDSLMIGFTAEYAGNDIVVDTKELVDARWFPYNQLPQIPQPPSMAWKLIDWFVRENSKCSSS